MASLALLSNVTIGPPFLLKPLRAENDLILPAGYDTWRQTLLKNDSQTDAIFLILDGRAYLESLNPREPTEIRARIEEDMELIRQFRRNNDSPLFVSTLDIPPLQNRALSEFSPEALAMNLWRMELEKEKIPLLELDALAAHMGRRNFYSPSAWYSGRVPWSMEGQRAIGEEILRLWNVTHSPRKKVLLLDLDNTLWGGVIGEDGASGIKLGQSGLGAAYRDFQKRLKELRERGTLLAIVSKNNHEDVMEVLNNHPDMILRADDFAIIKANWLPKAENIIEIANELNLGADSFVFVDDNPVEREAVKIALPEIAVPDFPAHPALLPEFGRSIGKKYFTALSISEEDLFKTRAYQAESRRKNEAKNFINLADFLKSLDMRLTVREVQKGDIPRAAQLAQKTNQFNLTTRRYTEKDIGQMLTDSIWKLFKASLEDKYGDFGVIALCFAKIDNKKANLDTFLMSCRAMGRGVEEAFLASIENHLRGMGVKEIYGQYIPTRKNKPVENFFPEHGYRLLENGLFAKRPEIKNILSETITVDFAVDSPC